MENKIDYWLIVTIILLLLISFLAGFILSQKLDSKPKSMQNFYNLGFKEGFDYFIKDVCDDGLITIRDQKIPLIKICEQNKADGK